MKCRGRDVVVIEVPRADRQDRPVYIGKDIFSNPGVFRVNKAVAVEGGTSDARNARNAHIFNIFALVDSGERSGMGLADLYGHWKKHGLLEPVISEEYDPDRVKVTVYTDSGQSTANRPKSAQETAQGAPKVPQGGPEPDQNPTTTRPRPGRSHGLICRRHVGEYMKH